MALFQEIGKANTFIEQSMVIDNFVTIVATKLKNSSYRVFSNSVKYKWAENNFIPVIPDASINGNVENRCSTSFLGVPRFIMDVVSDITDTHKYIEKMELYKKVEVAEYWIIDWRKKQVEIYLLVPDENTLDNMEYKLMMTVTESNKLDLKLYHFPYIPINFDDLFDGLN